MIQIAIAPWQWNTSEPEWPCWDAPEVAKCIGRLDLRSLPECGQLGGTPAKRGDIFVYPTVPVGMDGLGALTDNIPFAKRLDLKKIYEFHDDAAQSPSNVLEFILWLFNTQADPTGEHRWKPLRGSVRTPPRLYLAGKEVWRGKTGDVLNNTIAVFRADYPRLKEQLPLEHLRKVTGAKMLSLYGHMGDDLLEPLLGLHASDGWDSPSTLLEESFNQGDSGTIGPDLTWVEFKNDAETVSNRASAVTQASSTGARPSTPLSSDDHYSQAECPVRPDVGSGGLLYTRKDASVTLTYYRAGYFWATSVFSSTMYKFVGGTPTQLGSTTDMPGESVTFTFKFTSEDSDHTFRTGTTDWISETDSAITGNTYAGFGFYRQSGDAAPVLDNFKAADVTAAGNALPMMMQLT